jgi:catalase-peroxidase
MLVGEADLLRLTVPERTALPGCMRARGASVNGSRCGFLADNPATLSSDFLVHLLAMATE